jgi:hypothetical protein
MQFPNGSLSVLATGQVAVSFGTDLARVETFANVTGTTVTLSMTPNVILSVSKNGLEERNGVDYTVAGQIITFSTALVSDNISVIYLQANQFNPSSAPYYQEFDPAQGATSVTLMNVPGMILGVYRSGVAQSTAKGDWTWSAGSAIVNFSDAFDLGEHVIVTWSQNFGGGNASTVNNLPAVPASAPQANSLVATDGTNHLPVAIMPTTTVFHEEFVPANAATTVTLSQTPQTIASVFRDGVIQSAQDGHYTISGNVITFADAFDGLSRVIVNYLYGVVLGDANTVKGFNASSATSPQPGTLVATDPTSGLLPYTIIPAIFRQNLLINGGFELWQRGTVFNTTGAYTADRWQLYFVLGTTGSGVNALQDTSIVDVGSSASLNCNYNPGTGGTPSYYLKNVIEDYKQLRGKTITLTGRMRQNTANTWFVRIACVSPTAGTLYSTPAYVAGGVFTTINTWFNFPAQTLAVPVDATLVQIEIQATAGVGGANSGAWFDNFMLVVGNTPIDYYPLTLADDLARCLRYYELIGPSGNTVIQRNFWAGDAGNYIEWYRLATRKAVSPTMTKVGTWAVSNCGQPIIGQGDFDAFQFYVTTNAAGRTYYFNSAAGQYLTAEANP